MLDALENQEGCAICGEETESGQRLHIDHDWKTNKYRGMLCQRCNVGLGTFKEDVNLMQKAIDYLNASLQNG